MVFSAQRSAQLAKVFQRSSARSAAGFPESALLDCSNSKVPFDRCTATSSTYSSETVSPSGALRRWWHRRSCCREYPRYWPAAVAFKGFSSSRRLIDRHNPVGGRRNRSPTSDLSRLSFKVERREQYASVTAQLADPSREQNGARSRV